MLKGYKWTGRFMGGPIRRENSRNGESGQIQKFNSKRVKEQVKIEKICALLCSVWSQAFVLNHWERGKF